MAWPCRGADIVVAKNDEPSFRQALQKANGMAGANRIVFASSAGTIQLTSPAVITAANLTIEGPATFDVRGLPLGLDIRASGVTVRNLRVLNVTNGGGGLRIVPTSAPLEDIIIEQCEVRGDNPNGNPVAVSIASAPGSSAGARVSRVRVANSFFDGLLGDGDAVLMGGSTANFLVEDVTIEGNVFQHCTYPVELAAGAGGTDGRIQRTIIRGNRFVSNAQAVSIGALGAAGSVIEQTLIEDNILIDNDHGMVMITGLGSSQARVLSTTIRGNEFRGAQQFALNVGFNGGGSATTRQNVIDGLLIDSNRIAGATAFGVYLSSGNADTQGNTTTNVQLLNNIVTGCQTGFLLGNDQGTGNHLDNVRIANNTVTGNRGAGISFALPARPGMEAINNIVWNNAINFGGSPAVNRANLFSDPLFVDAVNDNWSVHAGSAAIDAGSSDGAPATDYFGQARCGAAPDVGAIEHCPSRRRRVTR